MMAPRRPAVTPAGVSLPPARGPPGPARSATPARCAATSLPRSSAMIKLSAVTHWGIPVNDLDAAEQFYTEIMGFHALGRLSNGHMSAMEILGQEIVLFQRKEPLVRTPQQDGLLHPLAFELTADEFE